MRVLISIVVGMRCSQKFYGFLGDQRHPDGHPLFIGLPAECKNLLDKIFGAICCYQSFFQFSSAVFCTLIEHGKLSIANNCR